MFNDFVDQTRPVDSSVVARQHTILHLVTLLDPNPAHDGVASHIPPFFEGTSTWPAGCA